MCLMAKARLAVLKYILFQVRFCVPSIHVRIINYEYLNVITKNSYVGTHENKSRTLGKYLSRNENYEGMV